MLCGTQQENHLATGSWFNQLQPPFDNPAIRRALLSGISQSDAISAAVGDDAALWQDKVGFFQPGSTMANDAGIEVLTSKRDFAKVKTDLAAAGYKDETVVLPVPADMPLISGMSEVVADMLRKSSMTVYEQTMDWGTAVPKDAL